MNAFHFRNTFQFLTVLFILCSCTADIPEISPLPSDATILAFGDSLTHGTGAGRSESYPAILERLSGRTVINAGVPGEETTQGKSRLPTALDKSEPDLLILCHGGNDMLRKRNVQQMLKNLRSMIREAQNRNIPIVLISVPKPTIFLSSADLYAELAEEFNLPIEDGILAEILSDNSLKSDQIHPNAGGYKMMAEKIYILLQESGAI